tara:strand:+ start:943 stop:1107 length:165 start_codon:yes stop_codon:yes gene_type:complete
MHYESPKPKAIVKVRYSDFTESERESFDNMIQRVALANVEDYNAISFKIILDIH